MLPAHTNIVGAFFALPLPSEAWGDDSGSSDFASLIIGSPLLKLGGILEFPYSEPGINKFSKWEHETYVAVND